MKQYLHFPDRIILYYNPETENMFVYKLLTNQVHTTTSSRSLYFAKLKFFAGYWLISFGNPHPNFENAIRLHFPKNF